MVRALSKTIFTVLLPMFIGTNILQTVTGTSGSDSGVKRSAFLIVPLLASIQPAILLLVSSKLLLPHLFKIDPSSDIGRTLAVTCSFGNAGVLPFIFADALFRENAQLLQRCLSQVSLFTVGWSPFFWSFGKKILVGNLGSNDDSNSSSRISELKKQLKVFMPPPVVGVAVGLLLGLTPLGQLLFRPMDQTNTAPLSIVFTSIRNLGKTASPLALLVLTCSLAMGAKKKTRSASCTSNEETGQEAMGFLQRWACVSISRFILSPLVMYGLLSTFHKWGFIGSHQSEPMLWFVVLLQSIMPPAQNSVVLLQVADRGEEASEMAKFLFYVYATGMVPIVAIITASLDSFNLMP